MLDLLWMQALNLICLYGAEILPVFTQSQIANDLFIYLVLLKNEWIAVWKPLYLNNGGGGGGGCVKSEQILIVKSGHYTVKKKYLKGCNRLSLGSTLKRDNFAPYLSLKGAY